MTLDEIITKIEENYFTGAEALPGMETVEKLQATQEAIIGLARYLLTRETKDA